jgi:hypothetical protein
MLLSVNECAAVSTLWIAGARSIRFLFAFYDRRAAGAVWVAGFLSPRVILQEMFAIYSPTAAQRRKGETSATPA